MSIHWRQLDTPSKIDAIRSVWSAGVTSKQIAAHFDGATRNAIIGIYHRYPNSLIDKPLAPGHTVFDTKTKRIRRRRSSTAFPAANKVSKPLPEPVEAPTEARLCGKPLTMLQAKECRWPVNNAAGDELHLFCALPSERIYCAHHMGRAYREPESRAAIRSGEQQ